MPSTPSTHVKRLEKLARSSGNQLVKGFTDASSSYRMSLLTVLEDFLAIIEKLEMVEGRSALSTSIMRSKYGDVLAAFAVFASSTWTADEISAFEAQQQYRPRQEKAAFSVSVEEGAYAENRALREVAFHVFRVLDATVVAVQPDVEVEDTSKLKKKKDGSPAIWPASLSHFLPHGAERAVPAFISWSKLMNNISPIDVLSQLTIYCPLLVPVMTQDESLLPLITELFFQTSNSVLNPGSGHRNGPQYALVEQQLIHFSSIFRATWLTDQLQEEDGIFFRNNEETLTLLYNAICEALHLVEAATLNISVLGRNAIASGLINFAFLILECSQLTDTHLSLHPSLPPPDPKTSNSDSHLEFVELVCGAANFRDQHKCVALSCTTAGTDTEINLKYCHVCRGAQYCSKECQKSDWSKHKHVCKSLKVLLETYFNRDALGIKEIDLMMIDPESGIEEKLKQSAGLNEDEVALVTNYLGERGIAMRAFNYARVKRILVRT